MMSTLSPKTYIKAQLLMLEKLNLLFRRSRLYYVKFELNPKILNERFAALLYIYLDITLFWILINDIKT